MTIIPAIDIIEGKCVRLTQGDYSQKKIYNEDPLEVAKQFEDAGLDRLHLVDLDGAKKGQVRNWKVLGKIAGKTKLCIDFSGGINAQKDLNIAFDSGAYYISVGTMAVKNEMMVSGWLIAYGADRFIISADVKDEKIMIRGWTESTECTVHELIRRYKTKGIRQFICTDIRSDGMLRGAAFELYEKIRAKDPGIELIASGGISSVRDLKKLEEVGCRSVIIGKAIYEGKISLKELKTHQTSV